MNQDPLKSSVDVMHIISGDLWAGAEVQVFHTLTYLKQKGQFSIIAVLFNEGILKQKLEEHQIQTIIINEKSSSELAILKRLRRLQRRFNPKILHVHAYKEHILGYLSQILLPGRRAMVRTFHGLTVFPEGRLGLKGLKIVLRNKIENLFLNQKTTNIIAVSKDLEKILKRSFPKASVKQIYNAIPPGDDRVQPRDFIRRKNQINTNSFWIGTVARLTKVKNLDMLIEAGRILSLKKMDFRISIWGEGPLKNNLAEKIKNYRLQEYVRLEGFEPNIYQVLRSIDVFVLCSLHEGIPMSLLEAMSMGTPVICTNVGGISEVVQHNISGLLIPSTDAYSLTNAILDIRTDQEKRERMASVAKSRVEKSFRIEQTTEELINLYKNILQN